FSTIRNPAKFLHVVSFALVVLFGYGVDGLWRRYMQSGNTGPRLKTWWAKTTEFDRRWIKGCGIGLVITLVGWSIYAGSRRSLEAYLQTVQFDDTMARAIAGFSIAQI